jgi:hypothetical protein
MPDSLLLHQFAHRFGEMRDVFPQRGQIRGNVSGIALNVLGHESLLGESRRHRNDVG